MKLSMGDVVRDHRDMALGSVVGVTDHAGGKLVAFCVTGDAVRLSDPDGVDLVARRITPMTKNRRVWGRVSLALALLAALVSGHGVQELGAGWLLTLVAGLGGFTVVSLAYNWALHLVSPRRFRV